MRKSLGVLATAAILTWAIAGANPASAGSLSDGYITLTWDESTFYDQEGCTEYIFNYTRTTNDVFRISIVNRYGDNIGASRVGESAQPSGVVPVQVCRYQDDVGPRLTVRNIYRSTYVEAPLTFQARPTQATASGSANSVDCINKKTFKQKTFKGKWGKKDKCPKGWVKL